MWLIARVAHLGRRLQTSAGSTAEGAQPALEIGALHQRLATAQQIAECGLVQPRLPRVADLQIRHTQPAGMPRAGQRHVEQAQVLAQTLSLGALEGLLVRLEQHAAAFAVLYQQRFLLIQRTEAADEWQEYQGILQALRLVDGHHPHQRLVAFQAQYLFVSALPLPGQQLAEVADQRLFAVQFAGGLLQQLGQVQQVGQHPLAIVLPHQALRQAEVLQQQAQHRQHALALPALAIAAKLHDATLPAALIEVEALQLAQWQAQRGAGQGRAQRAILIRLGAGAQPQQQVTRLLSGEYRILVRQVNAAHPARAQLTANRLRLAEVTHQHGDVTGLQRAQFTAAQEAGLLLLPLVEQRDDLTRGGTRQRFHVGLLRQRLLRAQVPQCQRRLLLALDRPAFLAPLRTDLDERQIITQQEGAGAGLTSLRCQEQRIDRIDHGLAGAEVGFQVVVAPMGRAACAQVGVNVGAAEGIDGLLGVTDHEQPAVLAVGLDLVEGVEDAVLQRIGVLELVDHRDRELATDDLGQARPVLALQGDIEAGEHVVEAHLGALAFLPVETRVHPGGGMTQRRLARIAQCAQARLQLSHGQQCRMLRRLALPGFRQAIGRQALEAGSQIDHGLLAARPLPQLMQPRVVVARLDLARVHLLVGDGLVEQQLQLFDPCRPGRLQRRQLDLAGAQCLVEQGAERLRGNFGRIPEQRTQAHAKPVRRAPLLCDPVQCRALQGVAMLPPVVAHDLGQQLAVIGLQGLAEQAAAVEGMLTQHALAPAMNGGDGRLVHPLRGQLQAPGAIEPPGGVEVIAQRRQQGIALAVTAKHTRRLHQAGTDAVTQLTGGGIGEGHHQDLRRQQGFGERRVIAMT